ncbi:Gag polyprotein [Frankliniella fusca]|uniref:Gag polyprotein n=1 Tax=Frankliniella fusca TaxID=407009 RepID=A0AAE1H8Q8_9NEOP|nr:Gag polyprotein [Frankliniella fusca]
MAQAPLATLRPFNRADGPFSSWFQQFEDYCFLYEIPEEEPDEDDFIPHNRRRALFLANMGPVAFQALINGCAPDRPNQYPIAELSDILIDRFDNPGLKSVNRLTFEKRVQGEQESATEFMDAITSMADKCHFGPFRDEAIIDRIIAGVRSDRARNQLLESEDIDLARVKRIVLQAEAVRTHARAIAQSLPVGKVDSRASTSHHQQNQHHRSQQQNPHQQLKPQDSKDQPQRKWKPCYRCTKLHDGRSCPAINWTCSKCSKKGHIAKACRSRQLNSIQQQPPQGTSNPSSADPGPSHSNPSNLNSISVDEEVTSLFDIIKSLNSTA